MKRLLIILSIAASFGFLADPATAQTVEQLKKELAVKNAETSTAMLTDKMANVLSTNAEVCTAGDASCLLHIGGGLSRLRSGTRTVHLAEILASTEEAVTPQQSTRPAVRT